MENMQSPYHSDELNSAVFKGNMAFLADLETSVKDHPVFDHSFLRRLADGEFGRDGTRFVMIQIGKMVKPFTAAISALMGRAPDTKSRFVLFDNLYEEMGRGDVSQSHPMLYLKMLESMGIDEASFEKEETITSVRLLNDALFDAILRKPFYVGCSWLGYGGELTIPNNFPYLINALRDSYGDELNIDFWARHGSRDQEHSDDATTVLAMNMKPEDRRTIEEEVHSSLTLRKLIWDEFEHHCERFSNSDAA